MDSIPGWLAKIELTLNVEKCEVSFFGSGNPEKLKMQTKSPE